VALRVLGLGEMMDICRSAKVTNVLNGWSRVLRHIIFFFTSVFIWLALYYGSYYALSYLDFHNYILFIVLVLPVAFNLFFAYCLSLLRSFFGVTIIILYSVAVCACLIAANLYVVCYFSPRSCL